MAKEVEDIPRNFSLGEFIHQSMLHVCARRYADIIQTAFKANKHIEKRK